MHSNLDHNRTIDRLLKELTDKESLKKYCYAGLSAAQKQWLKSQDRPVYQGKVREVIEGDQAKAKNSAPYLLINHTDRLTAFDCFIDNIPLKGQILAAFSEFWFQSLPSSIPHHFMERVHPRVLKTLKCQPIKVEVVVRNYLAGSMLRSYLAGERTFCGHTLPEGLQPFEKLPHPIITPTTKAAVFEHDLPTTASELIAQEVVDRQQWQVIEQLSHQMFRFGSQLLADRGYLLVDTKYEFGIAPQGDIIVIDEIHTPDSSRFWLQESYQERMQSRTPPEMFDKETIRTWLIEHGFTGYGPVPDVPAHKLIELALSYYQLYVVISGKSELANTVPFDNW